MIVCNSPDQLNINKQNIKENKSSEIRARDGFLLASQQCEIVILKKKNTKIIIAEVTTNYAQFSFSTVKSV